MKVWYVAEADLFKLRVKTDSPDPDLPEISTQAREDCINFVYCDKLTPS